MSHRWLDRVFLAAVAANLAPVLWFPFLPTRDGPAHVLGATWIRELVAGHALAVDGLVAWNPAPVPNWFGHAFMALAGAFVGPWVAERLLLALIVVALPLSLRYALRSVTAQPTGLEFLALPLVWGTHLHWGFYNFCVSLAAYLVCVGYWWRHRGDLATRHLTVWALLLVVTYFSSILALVHVLASVAMLAVFEPAQRLRAVRLTLAAAVPAMTLWVLFVVLEPVGPRMPTTFPAPLWAAANLVRLDILRSGQASDHGAALVAACAAWALVAYWVLRRPLFVKAAASWPWLALVLLDVCVLFLAPTSIGGGTLLTPRQAVFAVFAMVLWMASQSNRLPNAAVVGGVAICLTLGMHASRWAHYGSYSQAVQTLIDGSPNSLAGRALFATALDDGLRDQNGVWPTAHAGAYVAVARGAMLVNQYELLTSHFPLIATRITGVNTTLRAEGDRHVEAVLLWGGSEDAMMRVGSQLLGEGTGDCRLAFDTIGPARLFSCLKR